MHGMDLDLTEFNDLKFMEWEVSWQFVNDLTLMEWTLTWPKQKWMEWNLTWQFVNDLKIDGMESRFLVWGWAKTHVQLHSTKKPDIKHVWFSPWTRHEICLFFVWVSPEPDMKYVWFLFASALNQKWNMSGFYVLFILGGLNQTLNMLCFLGKKN